ATVRVAERTEHRHAERREVAHVNARHDVGAVSRDAKIAAEKAPVKAAPGAVNAGRAQHGAADVAVRAFGGEPCGGARLAAVDLGRFVDLAARPAVDAGRRDVDSARAEERGRDLS